MHNQQAQIRISVELTSQQFLALSTAILEPKKKEATIPPLPKIWLNWQWFMMTFMMMLLNIVIFIKLMFKVMLKTRFSDSAHLKIPQNQLHLNLTLQ